MAAWGMSLGAVGSMPIRLAGTRPRPDAAMSTLCRTEAPATLERGPTVDESTRWKLIVPRENLMPSRKPAPPTAKPKPARKAPAKKRPARGALNAPAAPAPPYVGYNASRFLSPEQLLAGVAEVIALAREEGVEVVLVGGLAMQLYGSDRLTGDLDFAAGATLDALPPIRELTFGGVQTTTPSGVPVDFIVRNDDYRLLYQEAMNVSPLATAFGVRVVPPNYLVAMKMAAGRDKDTLDLKFLLAQDGLVDEVATRAIVRRHLGPYAAQEFDRITDEVAWQKQRGRR